MSAVVSVLNRCGTKGIPVVVGHSLRLTLAKQGSVKPHGGVCACGWFAQQSNAAGIIHAQHDAHLTEVESQRERVA